MVPSMTRLQLLIVNCVQLHAYWTHSHSLAPSRTGCVRFFRSRRGQSVGRADASRFVAPAPLIVSSIFQNIFPTNSADCCSKIAFHFHTSEVMRPKVMRIFYTRIMTSFLTLKFWRQKAAFLLGDIIDINVFLSLLIHWMSRRNVCADCIS